MTDTSLKQKCSVWYHVWGGVVVVACMVVVFMVVVCGGAWIMVRVINEMHPTGQPADAIQETLNSIDDTMVYPKVWWSDRTLTIYFVEVSNQLRSCSPIERPILETRLNHYYNMMIERGIHD